MRTMTRNPKSKSDVMEILGKQNASFPTNQEIGNQSAEDILSDETENDAKTRIGSMVISTTGGPKSISVPHSKLEDKMKLLGFPESAIPSKTSPSKAFTRAKNDLKDSLTDHFEFEGHDASISMWSEGWYCKHIVAEYIDGTAQTVNLGKIKYNPDKKKVFATMNINITESKLADFWHTNVVAEIQRLFSYHKERHNGKDIAHLQNMLNQKTKGSIKLRRAVYFYPATTRGFDKVLESFRKLYNWINNYKQRGERAEFFYTPMFNREADREFISDKLRQNLENEMESLVEDISSNLSDDADEIARSVLEPALKQMDSKIQEFEAISESTPKIERMLESIISEMTKDAQERARKVVEQTNRSTENTLDTVE